MYTETIKYYDTSTMKDLPDTADHMVRSETMSMWEYPEPEHCMAIDGSPFTIAGWYIVTSIGSSYRHHGDDIFMGGDSVIYTGEEEE